jgi:hypothetical protein
MRLESDFPGSSTLISPTSFPSRLVSLAASTQALITLDSPEWAEQFEQFLSRAVSTTYIYL